MPSWKKVMNTAVDPLYSTGNKWISPQVMAEEIIPAESYLHPHRKRLMKEEEEEHKREVAKRKSKEWEEMRARFQEVTGMDPQRTSYAKAGGMVRLSRGDGKARLPRGDGKARRGRTRGRTT
jgi:hypothetical protein